MTKLNIDQAFQQFRGTLNKGADTDYFLEHEVRYRRIVQRVTAHFSSSKEPNMKAPQLLDIGAHFLHVASILSLMGYSVCGMDVSLFTEQSFIQTRAKQHQIVLHTENDLSAGTFMPEHHGCFDLILFTEALEHITFNPVRFWQRVATLLTPVGAVYLATPNAARLMHRVATIKRALSGSCIGLEVKSVVLDATYSHHWKEYTVSEIHEYFAMIFEKPALQLDTYRYRAIYAPNSIKDFVRWLTRKIGAFIPSMREEIDGFLTLPAPKLRLAAPADLHGATYLPQRDRSNL